VLHELCCREKHILIIATELGDERAIFWARLKVVWPTFRFSKKNIRVNHRGVA
jgi:hypothetical protein